MKLNFNILTLGCSKNTVDSENMAALLMNEGHHYVTQMKDAQVLIINTCSFILDAKKESIDAILEAGMLKKKSNLKIIVVGCLSQRYQAELLELLPEIDVVMGTGALEKITDIFETIEKNQTPTAFQIGNVQHQFLSLTQRGTKFKNHYRYLKISEGCNHHCSYCIIPSLRGRYHSRSIDDILKEAEMLATHGTKELILIAQDTSVYGKDLYGQKMFYSLLERLSQIEEIAWIRVHYLYPESIDEEIIRGFQDFDKLLPYIDMPIQHSHDSVLRAMGRNITEKEILYLVERLRAKIPKVILRTSLITGFPGETEAHFQHMMAHIQEVKYERLGVFAFSKEEGTQAYHLKNQIAEQVKEDRREKLMLLQGVINEHQNKALLGTKLPVMIDGNINTNHYIGRSYMDSPDIDQEIGIFTKKKLHPGQIVDVHITESEIYSLKGEC